jgi:hypothetical protein
MTKNSLILVWIALLSQLTSCHKSNHDDEYAKYLQQREAEFVDYLKKHQKHEDKKLAQGDDETRNFLLELWTTKELKKFVPILNMFALDHGLGSFEPPALYMELALNIKSLGAHKLSWNIRLAEPTSDGRAILSLNKNVRGPDDGAAIQIERWVSLDTLNPTVEELYRRAQDYSERNNAASVDESVLREERSL